VTVLPKLNAAVTNPVIRLLPLIPHANVGASGFAGSATAPVNIDRWTTDISRTLGANDRLHGYYAINVTNGVNPLSGKYRSGFWRHAHPRQILRLINTHWIECSQ
jgi:hypothetical protein